MMDSLPCRTLLSLVFLATACPTSPDSGDSSETDDTGAHPPLGEPRSDCTFDPGDGRTPWLMPEVAVSWLDDPVKLGDDINTACPEDAMEVSRDGDMLYFLWSPAVDASADELLNGTTGTYVASRSTSGPGDFADPRFFDLGQGATSGSYDGELSFSPDGSRVWFHSTRAENTGYQAEPPVDDPMDIYVADVVDGVPGPAENLGAPMNTTALEGEHCISPDGERLYFSSDRDGGIGGIDIWSSDWDGTAWSEPVNLGTPINSSSSDMQPAFAADDPATMYLVSDRDGDSSIFRSGWDGTTWSDPERIVTGYVGEPSLPADGSVLYFVHVLVDDAGVFGSDIWYTLTH